LKMQMQNKIIKSCTTFKSSNLNKQAAYASWVSGKQAQLEYKFK
jgi:hypothetical protein